MPVVRTPRAIIEVLGAPDEFGRFPVTGYEIENFYSWEGEGSEHFTAKVQRDVATSEEVATLRQTSADTLTRQLQRLNAQIADMQTSSQNLQARLDAALSALESARQSDANWDQGGRVQVLQVLQSEGR